MTISDKDKRLLFQRSANRCAFPGCGKELTFTDVTSGVQSAVSEMAHIVAESIGGPRGTYPLPQEERDKYTNLILLCNEHHKVVDDHPATYPVEKLRRWKAEHEERMSRATGDAVVKHEQLSASYISEILYSTLLPVMNLPMYVFSALCKYDQSEGEQARQNIIYPKSSEMVPFILREGRIYCFQDLREEHSPFRNLITEPNSITRHHAKDWWLLPDRERWYTELLNRTLNKLTGRKGLNWDKEHKRYYFKPEVMGQSLEITYQPMNQSKTSRSVVWQPVTKKTGLAKPFWFHAAVGLKFHRVSRTQWCLSIRPEMHITQDGVSAYPSEKKGSRITRKKSRMFNYELLGELQFWRDYLGDGKPRILFPLGSQYIQISTNFLQSEVNWPGMPEEFAKPFKNAEYVDDLFSYMELQQFDEAMMSNELGDENDEEDEWDE